MLLKVLKPGKYGTRRLAAGETFDASAKEARVWKALKRATDADIATAVVPPVRGPAVSLDPLDGIRAQAEGLGVKVDRRWGEARIKHEIAEASAPAKTYERRDMRAED